MVDLQRCRGRLADQLISTNIIERATILVVGPGGSCKTFLVKNVFQNKQVREKFDCRAWIHVHLLVRWKYFCWTCSSSFFQERMIKYVWKS